MCTDAVAQTLHTAALPLQQYNPTLSLASSVDVLPRVLLRSAHPAASVCAAHLQAFEAASNMPGTGSASSSSDTCEQVSLRDNCLDPCLQQRDYITARQLLEFKRKLSEQVLIDSFAAAKP